MNLELLKEALIYEQKRRKTFKKFRCVKCVYERYRCKECRERKSDDSSLGSKMRALGSNPIEFDIKLKEQNGVCEICGGLPRGRKRLSIDHDHKTGMVRGLLCGHCNSILGFGLDSETILSSALNYLNKYNSIQHKKYGK